MTSTREAMTMLRSANPVPSSPELAPGAPQLLEAAPVRSRTRARRGLVLAAAVVVVLAFGLGVVPLPWTHGVATPAAADALDKAARAADITARDEQAGPGQWWRITTEATSLSAGGGNGVVDQYSLVRSTRTEYVSVDGSRPGWVVDSPWRVVRTLSGSPAGGTSGAGETWTSDLAPNDIPGSWQMTNPAWLATLPRDTDALRDRLYDDTSGHGRSHDGEVLVYVADVLRTGQVPADLRAALFRVLETVPGVDVVQRHEDGLISIGRLEGKDGQRQEIIIDPESGAYVGEITVQVKAMDGIPAGTVIGDATVSRTVVDAVPAAVQDAAVHYRCTTFADGGVGCERGVK